MNKKEIQELIFTILKDQNFDFKSYPDLWVYYSYNAVLDIALNTTDSAFRTIFETKNLDLNYEIIQVITNRFLKFFKIHNFREGEIIDTREYNEEEFQNLIDQYYLEMFGEKNRIIETVLFSDLTLWLYTNDLYINIKLPLSEIQLEEYIKLIRSYEQ